MPTTSRATPTRSNNSAPGADELGRGAVGLIFLAGLQLDLEAFVRFRVISAGFGLLMVFIPMALGTVVALLLGIDMRPAVLIGSFWASFTLIACPTVARYGLTKTRPVAAIVGASAITDAISLVVLALIVGAETGDTTGARLVLDIGIEFVVLLLGRSGPEDLRAQMVGATYSEIVAATSVATAIAALHPDTDRGRVFLYSVAREFAPGKLPATALALELASTLSRTRDEALIVGPVAPSALEAAGLTTPPTVEHCDGPEDLDQWAAAVTRPGDLLVVPIHDTSFGPAAIRVYSSGRSVLAVSQNPATSAASVISPMNVPLGRSLGT